MAPRPSPRANRGLSRSAMLLLAAGLAAGAWVINTLLQQPPPEPTQPDPRTEPEIEAPVGLDKPVAIVDEARIAGIETAEPGAWLTYGRNYEEQRFSPLTDINRETVNGLDLAWFKDLDTIHKVEATPLVIDGVMYVTAPFNITYALDAASGEEIWRFDPEVPGETARLACCGVVSRGLAAYKGRIYLATLDGRLIALDAATGRKFWEVDTIIDRDPRLHHHRRPAAARRQGLHRQRRRRIRRARLRHRLRRRTPAKSSGASTPCPAIRRYRSSTRRWKWPPRPGRAATGGRSAAAAPCGTPSSTIPTSTPLSRRRQRRAWSRVIRSPGGGDNLFLASIVALDRGHRRNEVVLPDRRPATTGTTPPCRT